MTQKINKIIAEIERTRARVAESQERLRELERQRTELENTEIVALFRSLDVSPDQLPAFIAAMKTAALPEAEAVVAAPLPAASNSTTFGYEPKQEEDENEN